MTNTKPKMVVYETPTTDETLEGSGITKNRLSNAFKAAYFGNVGEFKNPLKNFHVELNKCSTKEISLESAEHLAHTIIHFGTKALIGSEHCQFNGKSVKVEDVPQIIQKLKMEDLKSRHEKALSEVALIECEIELASL